MPNKAPQKTSPGKCTAKYMREKETMVAQRKSVTVRMRCLNKNERKVVTAKQLAA